jgi:hypothetical protein
MSPQISGASIVSVFALIVSICSAGFAWGTFYYGQLRSAHLVATVGNYIYLEGRPRLGVPVSFYNEGALTGVINSGNLTLSDGANKFYFRLSLVSTAPEKWTTDGNKITPMPAPFSLFSQVAVKGKDTTDGVFWYSPQGADIKFQPDKDYTAYLTFSRKAAGEDQPTPGNSLREEQQCTTSVQFHVSKVTAENAAKTPTVVLPVDLGLSAAP